ncbi:hypothetical protein MO973_14615 [Paenibacillus sp. TRM 82003]|nr:hypothetical protein [Paenibacillus sp. TRM 82003]
MDKRKPVTVTVEIEAYEEAEHSIRDLLAFLQYTNKINRFTYTVKTKQEAAPKDQGGRGKRAQLDNVIRWKLNQQLIRVRATTGRSKPLDIACKIVNYDLTGGTITVYDVDRKQVEQLNWDDIDDMHPAIDG